MSRADAVVQYHEQVLGRPLTEGERAAVAQTVTYRAAQAVDVAELAIEDAARRYGVALGDFLSRLSGGGLPLLCQCGRRHHSYLAMQRHIAAEHPRYRKYTRL